MRRKGDLLALADKLEAPTAEELRRARVHSALRSAANDLDQALLDMRASDDGAAQVAAMKLGLEKTLQEIE